MSALVKPITWIIGLLLVALGILGFVMGSPLFGYFDFDATQNVVLIISGLIGLLMAPKWGRARLFLLVFGIFFGIITVLGFATGQVLSFFYVNQADNYLYLVLAVVCFLVGFSAKKP